MPEEEKAAIIESLTALSKNDKNFILGYMAGRTAEKQEEKPDKETAEGK